MLNHVTRREFLAAAGTASIARAQAGRRPNIVFIMADDLGYGDLGCYGPKKIRTPNIDRLAAEGLKFTQAYAGCTVCAPSRSVLMTGFHMGHTSVRSNPGGVPLIDSDFTVAEMLKKAGYATGGFGKWGLGDAGTTGAPEKQGFDEFFGYLNQVHAHYFYPEFLYQNGRRFPLEGNDKGRRTYSHDVIASKALDFIERNRSHPFFCYVPFTIPHLELLVPEDSIAEYRGKFEERPYKDPRDHYAAQPESRAAYAGMITRMDRDVGRITSLLTRLGIDDNTIVFFTSDNGAASPLWRDDYFNSTGGLRGHKQNLYEGGIRVPMVARWKGRIGAGKVSDHPWAFWDFMPTAAELAGVQAPDGIDGLSVVPTLLGQGRQRIHDFLYWEIPRYNSQKREFLREVPMQAVRTGDWKAVRPKPDGPLELYNLKTDPGESKDVSSANPKMIARIEKYLKTARTEPRPQQDPEQDFRKQNSPR